MYYVCTTTQFLGYESWAGSWKSAVAHEYGVGEKAIWKTWDNRDAIQQCSALMSEEVKMETIHASVGLFLEVEEKLYIWIDTMHWANVPVSPSLAIEKAKWIATELSITKDDFKVSWQWASCFRSCKGLQKILLHGEDREVDKNDPGLLAALDDLYAIIQWCDLENIYNMDEKGLFFWILLQYSILMPQENVSTVRGTKKAKEWLSLVACANATGTHKIPCTLIGKPKTLACIKNQE